MFDTVEIKKAFETFGKEVIQLSRSNLTRKGKNVSKELYNGMEYKFEGFKNGFTFIIRMPEYGLYQDEGVKGVNSSSKAPRSPYRFGSGTGKKGGLTQGIDRWVRSRRFQFRKPNGQFMSYESTSFLIRRSIWQTGIPASNFFKDAFEAKFKRLEPKIEDAMVLDVERFLGRIKKQIEKQ